MFGRATGNGDDGFQEAELVIVTVGADGSVSPLTTIPLEGMNGLPCAIWAPDGRWAAFGGADAETPRIGGADGVWLVDTVSGEVRQLPGYHPNDLEWRPGTDELAITGDRPVNQRRRQHRHLHGEHRRHPLPRRRAGRQPDVVTRWDDDRLHPRRERTRPTGIWLIDADGTNLRPLTRAPAGRSTGSVSCGPTR